MINWRTVLHWLLRLVFALTPLLLGIGIRLILVFGEFENPTISLKGEIGTWLVYAGFILTIFLLPVLAGWGWLEYKQTTELVRVQTEANKAFSDDRRRFLQRLDHELKNPLTAIQAGLANLGERPEPNALASVKAQTSRVSRLVADLRKLADLETRPLERAPVNLGEILETLTELAREGEFSNRHISLTIPQAPWPLPEVSGDYDLLLLAIHNLLNNALKFTKPGDRVEVRALEDGQSVVVEVADTGPGIPDEELPHVWEELYRGKGARGVPGSGLGLALVRAIIDRHGGQVAIRSRAGQGTVLSLRLPAGGG
jgi:two-component system, OmpR family, sensor kinase